MRTIQAIQVLGSILLYFIIGVELFVNMPIKLRSGDKDETTPKPTPTTITITMGLIVTLLFTYLMSRVLVLPLPIILICIGLYLIWQSTLSMTTQKEYFEGNPTAIIGVGCFLMCCCLILVLVVISIIQNAQRLSLAGQAAKAGDWGAAAQLGTSGVQGSSGYGNRYGQPALINLKL